MIKPTEKDINTRQISFPNYFNLIVLKIIILSSLIHIWNKISRKGGEETAAHSTQANAWAAGRQHAELKAQATGRILIVE